MRRFLFGAGILALPWIVGGTIAAAAGGAVWANPVTVRVPRVMPIRARLPRVESGHIVGDE